jgi:PTH1 family peptidyl-tRNA hydrolase
MVNTIARAHVVGPAPTPASAADPDLENYRTSDHDIDEPIQITQPLNRRERRKQKKQKATEDRLVSVELEDPEPVQALQLSDDESDELTDESARLSRKQRKKLEKQKRKAESASSDQTPTHTSSQKSPPKTANPTSALSIHPSLSGYSMSTAKYFPLLICSLGNPGAQYANTLHSAGHTVLNHIRERGLYSSFQKGMSGLVAKPDRRVLKYNVIYGYQKATGERNLVEEGEDDFTLWQSTKLMNISGPSVQNAWREFSAQQRSKGFEGRLVVVHDELESPLGKVSIKEGSASPRGHNGLKSVQASMGANKWWRVGVGIGRPESREPSVVSKYVLRKMTFAEEKAIDKAAIDVLGALRKVAEGKV